MAFAGIAASRKLLHSSGGAVGRVVAADGDAVGMSFGLGGLWQLIVGLLGSVAHLLVLPFELLWRLLQTAVTGATHLILLPFEPAAGHPEGISLCFDGLWHLVFGIFSSLLAVVGNAAHLLVLPFEALWHLLQATAANAVAGITLCFEGIGHLIHGFVANFLAAVGNAGHAVVTPFEALWHLLQATGGNVAAGITLCFEGIGHLIHGFVANLLAAVGNAGHAVVAPFEALWHLLQATAANATAGISHCFEGIGHLIHGFVANLLAAVGNAGHAVVAPFEALWHLLQATAANATAGISHYFEGIGHVIHGFVANLLVAVGSAGHVLVALFEALCRWLQIAAASVQGIFPSLLDALSSAAHKLILSFEAFGQWIQAIVADAAAGISIGLDGFWPLIRRSYASVIATLAGAADELVPALEAFLRWVKTTAAAALPFVLCVAVVVSLVALVWFFGLPLLGTAAGLTVEVLTPAVFCFRAVGVGIAKVLVQLVCWTAQYLHVIAMVVGRALSYLLPVCMYCFQCCASATMNAPGAAGFLISRAAFVANPSLYFQILRTAGSVVASATFSTPTIASAVAAPVAQIFRA